MALERAGRKNAPLRKRLLRRGWEPAEGKAKHRRTYLAFLRPNNGSPERARIVFGEADLDIIMGIIVM